MKVNVVRITMDSINDLLLWVYLFKKLSGEGCGLFVRNFSWCPTDSSVGSNSPTALLFSKEVPHTLEVSVNVRRGYGVAFKIPDQAA